MTTSFLLSADKRSALVTALQAAGFRGALEADTALRAAMSTDNSVYQITPDLIAAPRDAQDMVTLLSVLETPAFADVPVTARGGGTGTNGQSLNAGLIVDTRRHMSGLIALNAAEGWADVQPGMVLDDLNAQIRHSGWFFAPETSTSTRCTIGGMVSTDASGKGSRVYGKTSDNLLGIEIARPQGLLFSGDAPPDWAQPMLAAAEQAARAGRAAFVQATPRLNRRFTGYDLERACPEDGGFDWWRLFPGSEGTLGLISRIRVKLTRIEPEKRLIVAAFTSLRAALASAPPLLAANPTAIEVMDEQVQHLAQQAGLLNRLPAALRPGQGARLAYVFVEINDATPASAEARVQDCHAILARLPGMGALYVAADLAEIRALWAVRSAGVGLLGKVQGRARPVAFVEDTVVPPENLPAFVDDFLALLAAEGVSFGLYGHVDVGCLHIRPALDIDSAADRARLLRISDAVYALTRTHGGIFWGEHGKGVRGAYLRDWIGPQAYAALQGVKAAFDPAGRYNPGKLVDAGDRIMGIATTPFRAFNAPADDALDLAFRCNGNAQCLSYAASTPMCPSFKASADVRHSPKGRADALRAWHSARRSNAPDLATREADLRGVLDTCLGCKACASSCPVQVDIPSMRSAFYADYHRRHRRPLADRLTLMAERHSPRVQRLAPLLAPLWPLAARIGEALTGTTDLPRRLAPRPQQALTAADLGQPLPAGTVILVQDWFSALFDPQAAQDALAGLRALGYQPRLLDMRPGGKAAHGMGDMAGFTRMARHLADLLHAAARTGAPLVAFEPAFGMMLRQDYAKAGIAVPKVRMAQEFLRDEQAAGRRFPQATGQATLLGHCTETTAQPNSAQDWADVFAALGLTLATPATGCCGMAGLFGHQKRHQTTSRRLFDLSWRAPLDSADPVVATGFSCRCQSQRFAGTALRHPLGLIAERLAPDLARDPAPAPAPGTP